METVKSFDNFTISIYFNKINYLEIIASKNYTIRRLQHHIKQMILSVSYTHLEGDCADWWCEISVSVRQESLSASR